MLAVGTPDTASISLNSPHLHVSFSNMDEGENSDPSSKERHSDSKWLLIVIFAMVAYPLSFGPFYYLSGKGYIGHTASRRIMRVYAPLIYMVQKVPQIEKLGEKYLEWWEKRI